MLLLLKRKKELAIRFGLFVLMFGLLLTNCRKDRPQTVILKNSLSMERNDELVLLDISKIFPKTAQAPGFFFSVKDEGREVPYQKLSDNRIAVLLHFKPYEQKVLTLRLLRDSHQQYHQRAHAEISIRNGAVLKNGKWIGGHFENVKRLSVGRDHFIHDALIRYEGPGLESDKIAYRIYLDKRNAMDVFGKRTSKIVLPIVGRDSSKTYHEMNWWGMDILKVGPTFGAGSFGLFRNDSTLANRLKSFSQKALPKIVLPEEVDSTVCTVIEDGPLRAGFQIYYHGWKIGNQKVDVVARHYIQAGSYLVKHEIELANGNHIGLAFGVMEPDASSFRIFTHDGYWKNISGIHALAGDSLTVFFYYDPKKLPGDVVHDEGNSVVFVSHKIKKITFWSGALWQGNFQGKNFRQICDRFAREESMRLANPVSVVYPKIK